MADVFPNTAFDTPALTNGWTVQSGPNEAGDQNLVKGTPVAPSSFSPVTSVNGETGPVVLQIPAQSATGQASFVAPSALTAAAKLSDLQAVAELVDALNAALVTAGLEV